MSRTGSTIVDRFGGRDGTQCGYCKLSTKQYSHGEYKLQTKIETNTSPNHSTDDAENSIVKRIHTFIVWKPVIYVYIGYCNTRSWHFKEFYVFNQSIKLAKSTMRNTWKM